MDMIQLLIEAKKEYEEQQHKEIDQSRYLYHTVILFWNFEKRSEHLYFHFQIKTYSGHSKRLKSRCHIWFIFPLGAEDRTKSSITNEDITAQAFVFFFAGFESVSRTLCFMAYELAVNPDVQQKLRLEINTVHEKANVKITYDTLMEMNYFDMVVSGNLHNIIFP